MRDKLPDILEQGRIRSGEWGSNTGDLFGAFLIVGPNGQEMKIISSGPEEWEHVSVSLKNRCPNWPEMCFVKKLFWGEQECVVQYHPVESEYVNCHPNCLHLWRPANAIIPVPPSILVGPKE